MGWGLEGCSSLVRAEADSWSRIVDNSPFPKRCILSQSMQRRDDFSRGESDWGGSWGLVTVGSVKEFPELQFTVPTRPQKVFSPSAPSVESRPTRSSISLENSTCGSLVTLQAFTVS